MELIYIAVSRFPGPFAPDNFHLVGYRKESFEDCGLTLNFRLRQLGEQDEWEMAVEQKLKREYLGPVWPPNIFLSRERNQAFHGIACS